MIESLKKESRLRHFVNDEDVNRYVVAGLREKLQLDEEDNKAAIYDSVDLFEYEKNGFTEDSEESHTYMYRGPAVQAGGDLLVIVGKPGRPGEGVLDYDLARFTRSLIDQISTQQEDYNEFQVHIVWFAPYGASKEMTERVKGVDSKSTVLAADDEGLEELVALVQQMMVSDAKVV